tara:strand:+ start:112852 stop:114132 length:1281 start_codon:yes stop_codon:yes gene_type:complete
MNRLGRLWEQSKASFRFNGLYLFMMGSASGLTFFKGLLLAVVLPASEFGLFVSVVAISTFTSSLISFGRVEGFMKSLPRRFESGDLASVFAMAGDAVRVLALRTLAVGAPAALVLQATSGLGLEVVLVAFTSLSYSLFNIYSSAIRATANPLGLARGALSRAAFALVISSLGGIVFGWQLAIVGEFFGALIAAALIRHWLHKTKPRDKATHAPLQADTSTERDGFFVFLALTLVAAPLYLDRIFVTTTFGSAMGGKYGFLLIVGMFSSTMVGIMAQSIGPRLVQQQHAGRPMREQLITILKTTLLCVSVSVVAIGFFVFCISVWPLAALWDKYAMDATSIILVSLISFFRVSEFFDWLLISHNAEKEMLYSSIVFAVFAVGISGAIYLYSAPFVYFLGGILVSRTAQFAVQTTFVVLKSRQIRMAQ